MDERLPGRPLLQPVMRGGRRLPQPTLETSRRYAAGEIGTLPPECLRLQEPVPIEPGRSAALQALAERVDLEFP